MPYSSKEAALAQKHQKPNKNSAPSESSRSSEHSKSVHLADHPSGRGGGQVGGDPVLFETCSEEVGLERMLWCFFDFGIGMHLLNVDMTRKDGSWWTPEGGI